MSKMNLVVTRTLALAALIGSIACGNSCFAQTYLERLERIVEQMQQKPASPDTPQAAAGSSEELPAPNDASTETAADPTRSILQPPAASNPIPLDPSAPAVNSGQPAQAPAPSGRIYLGLEAEEQVGGGLGVRVTEVTPDSPAWAAGIKVNDRIMAINGFAIADLDALADQLSQARPGQTCRFLVTRNSRNVELVAVLMDAELAGQIATQQALRDADNTAWLGVTAVDLTRAFRQQFGTQVFRGAAVTSVAAGSPAALKGIQAGDCIIELGAAPVEGLQDLQQLISQRRPGETVELVYFRGITRRSVRLTLQVEPQAAQPRPRVSQSPQTFQPDLSPQVAPPMPSQPPATGPLPAAPETGNDKDAVIAELQAEVETLRRELNDANQRLDEAQQRLMGILESLRINNLP